MSNIVTKIIIVFCTVPDETVANNISKRLVRENVAACCNIIKNVRSIYSWEGEIQDDSELLLIIKTSIDVYDHMQQIIMEEHPYSIPEIIALPIERGSINYLKWVKENVKKR